MGMGGSNIVPKIKMQKKSRSFILGFLARTGVFVNAPLLDAVFTIIFSVELISTIITKVFFPTTCAIVRLRSLNG